MNQWFSILEKDLTKQKGNSNLVELIINWHQNPTREIEELKINIYWNEKRKIMNKRKGIENRKSEYIYLTTLVEKPSHFSKNIFKTLNLCKGFNYSLYK